MASYLPVNVDYITCETFYFHFIPQSNALINGVPHFGSPVTPHRDSVLFFKCCSLLAVLGLGNVIFGY